MASDLASHHVSVPTKSDVCDRYRCRMQFVTASRRSTMIATPMIVSLCLFLPMMAGDGDTAYGLASHSDPMMLCGSCAAAIIDNNQKP